MSDYSQTPTPILMIELINAGVDPAMVSAIVDDMVATERRYLQEHGFPTNRSNIDDMFDILLAILVKHNIVERQPGESGNVVLDRRARLVVEMAGRINRGEVVIQQLG